MGSKRDFSAADNGWGLYNFFVYCSPYILVAHKRVALSKAEVEHLVLELARQGLDAASIGRKLKEMGIDAKAALGIKLTKFLFQHKAYPLEVPEDLFYLMKCAVNLREHLQKHRKDLHSRRGLELIESKIRGLASYCVRKKKLPKGWEYEPERAKLLVKSRVRG